MDPTKWEIGPIIKGESSSVGMPLHPSPHPDGWAFDFPQPDNSSGHVHYITTPYGSLAGKSQITLRFRIEAAPEVKIWPKNCVGCPSILALHFQRRGDNWSASGLYETYRWWASFKTLMPLAAGEYEVTAKLDENWTAIISSTAFTNPTAFQAAVTSAERVGFTLGGDDGLGHGVYATGPARLVVTQFKVE